MKVLPRPYPLALAVLFFVTWALAGCATGPQVERLDTDTTIDISGRWNDTDSRMVAEGMITDCLSSPWLPDFVSSHQGKKPVVIVGMVANRSHEHINVQTFTKDLERALINSGRVTFVASKMERQEIREEREDMAVHAVDETVKGPGKEAGADYMLKGTLNSIVDQSGGKKVVYYQTNLELISMSDNTKAWIGEKKIKKFITKPKFGM